MWVWPPASADNWSCAGPASIPELRARLCKFAQPALAAPGRNCLDDARVSGGRRSGQGAAGGHCLLHVADQMQRALKEE